MCSVLVVLFGGGWTLGSAVTEILANQPWFVAAFFNFGVFIAKVVTVVFFFMWVRWTLPRFRWDQLMKLGWTVLIPLALLNILITALGMEYGGWYAG